MEIVSRPLQESNFISPKKAVTIFERLFEAPSCVKFVQSSTDMCICDFSFTKFRYFWPFVVVPGLKKFAAPLI